MFPETCAILVSGNICFGVKMTKTTKTRIDTYREKQESSGQVRADLYIPEELRDRVKSISAQNNWKYLETLAALAALGTEVFENATDTDLLEKTAFLKDQMPSVSPTIEGLNAAVALRSFSAASASAGMSPPLLSAQSASDTSYSPEVFSSVPKAATRSALASFIEKRKGATK